MNIIALINQSEHYKSIGVTEAEAKACLSARMETRNCEPCEDGWEPEYSRACNGIKCKTNPQVLGQFLFEAMIERAFREIMEID